MMTMNYFWWLFRDTMMYTFQRPERDINNPKLKYTMTFMTELEEGIAQKLEREQQ